MGEGQCEEFPSEIGKKMQKKKLKKKQQEKNVVSGQCTRTVTFAGLKVCEGWLTRGGCKFWGPCVEKSKRGVDKRWRLVRSVWQVKEGYKWDSCPWLCLVWITRCSLPHHVSKGCHTVNRLPCLDEKVFFFLTWLWGRFLGRWDIVLASIAALDNCRFDRRLCGIPAPLLVCRMMEPWDVCLCFL